MGGFTDFLESGVLAKTFGRQSFPYVYPALYYYIGLATGTIAEDMSNLSTLEVAGDTVSCDISNILSGINYVLENYTIEKVLVLWYWEAVIDFELNNWDVIF